MTMLNKSLEIYMVICFYFQTNGLFHIKKNMLRKKKCSIIKVRDKKKKKTKDRDVRKPIAIGRPNVNTQVVTQSSNLYTQNIIVSDVQF